MSDSPARPLRRRDLEADPLHQFHAWFGDAGKAGVPFPEAAALATASARGEPSARMVLVKRVDEHGLVFHTGYASRKAHDLAENPRGALLFHWHPLGRQVRIEGPVRSIAAEESEAYFHTRPPGARLAAWASRQSEPIESRDELERRVEGARARFGDAPPFPEHWGGYRLLPEMYEFWQHRENRVHDRFRYRRDGGAWVIERLQP